MNCNIKDTDTLDFTAELEATLKTNNLTEDTKNDIRHQVTNNLLHRRQSVDLNKEEMQAVKDLQKDDDIVILSADKGRVTVVMGMIEHINKATLHLQDANTYLPSESDPTKTTTTRINKKLKILKDQKLGKSICNRIADPMTLLLSDSRAYLRFINQTYHLVP